MSKLIDTLSGHYRESSAIWNKVVQSLGVPQIGDHHHEGRTMDAHLDLMLQVLWDVREENLVPMPEVARHAIFRAVRAYPEQAEKFCLVHDIGKMDCMTVQWESPAVSLPVAMTWEEWQAQTLNGEPLQGMKAVRVQYFQELPSGKEPGKTFTRSHEEVGADWLEANGETDAVLLLAVREHGVTMSFNGILVDTWRRHFGNLGSEVQDFMLLANYLDAMASLNKDLGPDMEGFNHMARTYETSLALKVVEDTLVATPGMDKNTVINQMAKCKKHYLPMSDVPAMVEKLSRICKVGSFNRRTLASGLEILVRSGKVTREEATFVEEAMMDPAKGLPAVGKALGPKMGALRPVIDAAKE